MASLRRLLLLLLAAQQPRALSDRDAPCGRLARVAVPPLPRPLSAVGDARAARLAALIDGSPALAAADEDGTCDPSLAPDGEAKDEEEVAGAALGGVSALLHNRSARGEGA